MSGDPDDETRNYSSLRARWEERMKESESSAAVDRLHPNGATSSGGGGGGSGSKIPAWKRAMADKEKEASASSREEINEATGTGGAVAGASVPSWSRPEPNDQTVEKYVASPSSEGSSPTASSSPSAAARGNAEIVAEHALSVSAARSMFGSTVKRSSGGGGPTHRAAQWQAEASSSSPTNNNNNNNNNNSSSESADRAVSVSDAKNMFDRPAPPSSRPAWMMTARKSAAATKSEAGVSEAYAELSGPSTAAAAETTKRQRQQMQTQEEGSDRPDWLPEEDSAEGGGGTSRREQLYREASAPGIDTSEPPKYSRRDGDAVAADEEVEPDIVVDPEHEPNIAVEPDTAGWLQTREEEERDVAVEPEAAAAAAGWLQIDENKEEEQQQQQQQPAREEEVQPKPKEETRHKPRGWGTNLMRWLERRESERSMEANMDSVASPGEGGGGGGVRSTGSGSPSAYHSHRSPDAPDPIIEAPSTDEIDDGDDDDGSRQRGLDGAGRLGEEVDDEEAERRRRAKEEEAEAEAALLAMMEAENQRYAAEQEAALRHRAEEEEKEPPPPPTVAAEAAPIDFSTIHHGEDEGDYLDRSAEVLDADVEEMEEEEEGSDHLDTSAEGLEAADMSAAYGVGDMNDDHSDRELYDEDEVGDLDSSTSIDRLEQEFMDEAGRSDEEACATQDGHASEHGEDGDEEEVSPAPMRPPLVHEDSLISVDNTVMATEAARLRKELEAEIEQEEQEQLQMQMHDSGDSYAVANGKEDGMDGGVDVADSAVAMTDDEHSHEDGEEEIMSEDDDGMDSAAIAGAAAVALAAAATAGAVAGTAVNEPHEDNADDYDWGMDQNYNDEELVYNDRGLEVADTDVATGVAEDERFDEDYLYEGSAHNHDRGMDESYNDEEPHYDDHSIAMDDTAVAHGDHFDGDVVARDGAEVGVADAAGVGVDEEDSYGEHRTEDSKEDFSDDDDGMDSAAVAGAAAFTLAAAATAGAVAGTAVNEPYEDNADDYDWGMDQNYNDEELVYNDRGLEVADTDVATGVAEDERFDEDYLYEGSAHNHDRGMDESYNDEEPHYDDHSIAMDDTAVAHGDHFDGDVVARDGAEVGVADAAGVGVDEEDSYGEHRTEDSKEDFSDDDDGMDSAAVAGAAAFTLAAAATAGAVAGTAVNEPYEDNADDYDWGMDQNYNDEELVYNDRGLEVADTDVATGVAEDERFDEDYLYEGSAHNHDRGMDESYNDEEPHYDDHSIAMDDTAVAHGDHFDGDVVARDGAEVGVADAAGVGVDEEDSYGEHRTEDSKEDFSDDDDAKDSAAMAGAAAFTLAAAATAGAVAGTAVNEPYEDNADDYDWGMDQNYNDEELVYNDRGLEVADTDVATGVAEDERFDEDYLYEGSAHNHDRGMDESYNDEEPHYDDHSIAMDDTAVAHGDHFDGDVVARDGAEVGVADAAGVGVDEEDSYGEHRTEDSKEDFSDDDAKGSAAMAGVAAALAAAATAGVVVGTAENEHYEGRAYNHDERIDESYNDQEHEELPYDNSRGLEDLDLSEDNLQVDEEVMAEVPAAEAMQTSSSGESIEFHSTSAYDRPSSHLVSDEDDEEKREIIGRDDYNEEETTEIDHGVSDSDRDTDAYAMYSHPQDDADIDGQSGEKLYDYEDESDYIHEQEYESFSDDGLSDKDNDDDDDHHGLAGALAAAATVGTAAGLAAADNEDKDMHEEVNRLDYDKSENLEQQSGYGVSESRPSMIQEDSLLSIDDTVTAEAAARMREELAMEMDQERQAKTKGYGSDDSSYDYYRESESKRELKDRIDSLHEEIIGAKDDAFVDDHGDTSRGDSGMTYDNEIDKDHYSDDEDESNEGKGDAAVVGAAVALAGAATVGVVAGTMADEQPEVPPIEANVSSRSAVSQGNDTYLSWGEGGVQEQEIEANYGAAEAVRSYPEEEGQEELLDYGEEEDSYDEGGVAIDLAAPIDFSNPPEASAEDHYYDQTMEDSQYQEQTMQDHQHEEQNTDEEWEEAPEKDEESDNKAAYIAGGLLAGAATGAAIAAVASSPPRPEKESGDYGPQARSPSVRLQRKMPVKTPSERLQEKLAQGDSISEVRKSRLDALREDIEKDKRRAAAGDIEEDKHRAAAGDIESGMGATTLSQAEANQDNIDRDVKRSAATVAREDSDRAKPGVFTVAGQEYDPSLRTSAYSTKSKDSAAPPVIMATLVDDDNRDNEPEVELVHATAKEENFLELVKHDRKTKCMLCVFLFAFVGLAVGLSVALTRPSSSPTPMSAQDFSQQKYIQTGENIDGPGRTFQYGPGTYSKFGTSVSLNANGTRIAVGAPDYTASIYSQGERLGLVQVFEEQDGEWILLEPDIFGDLPGDAAGNAVSLSADGNTLAVGSPEHVDAVFGGQVKLYDFKDGFWQPLGSPIIGDDAFDRLGTSVALSGDGSRVAISVPTDKGPGRKSAKVYERRGNDWARLGDDLIGRYEADPVAISADGQAVALGSLSTVDNNYAATVRVYRYNDKSNGWTLQGSEIELKGAEGSYDTRWSPSLSADGMICAIGSAVENADATIIDEEYDLQVKVYRYNEQFGNWTQLGSTLHDKKGSHLIKYSVSLSADGEVLAIGDPGGFAMGTNSGHAHVLRLFNDEWVHVDKELEGTDAGDFFGFDVSMSADGRRVGVGAPKSRASGEEYGRAIVFEVSDLDG